MNEKNLPATTGDHQKVDKALALKFLDAMGLGTHLTAAQKEQFVEVAIAFNLNPFKREIHASVYQKWNPNTQQKEPVLSIITGYEVYLKRAERIGTLEGWHARTEGSVKDGTLKGIITIHKKGWEIPFEHEVDYSEYVQTKSDGTPNAMWGGKPKTMIKKVVTAQGFRLAFPDEFDGMPYTSDEPLDSMIDEVRDITPGKPAQPAQAGGFKRAEATDAEIVDDKGKPAAAAAKPAQPTPAAQETGKPAEQQAAQPEASAEELKARTEAKRKELKDREQAEAAGGIQKYSGLVSNVTRVKSIPNTCRVFIDDRVFMCIDMMLAELLNDLKGKRVMVSFTTDGENISTIKGAEELK